MIFSPHKCHEILDEEAKCLNCLNIFSDENTEILYGSEFLGYLYRQIIDVTEQDISVMLIAILSDCCDVYFR